VTTGGPEPRLAPARTGGGREPGAMRFHVGWRAFESITRIEDVARMQRTVIAVVERLAMSPRVLSHGVFVDARGGYAVVEVTEPGQLLELFAGLQDQARLTVDALAPTDDAIRFLRGMLATEQLG
jgi:hypothetical protein